MQDMNITFTDSVETATLRNRMPLPHQRRRFNQCADYVINADMQGWVADPVWPVYEINFTEE
jgi:hypothetical protein